MAAGMRAIGCHFVDQRNEQEARLLSVSVVQSVSKTQLRIRCAMRSNWPGGRLGLDDGLSEGQPTHRPCTLQC